VNDKVKTSCFLCGCTTVVSNPRIEDGRLKGSMLNVDEEDSVTGWYPLDQEDWEELRKIDAQRKPLDESVQYVLVP
jgi:hypothetical protein